MSLLDQSPAPKTARTVAEQLVEKSVGAVLSAVEIYNKPDFKYREESFTILMVNAWELLLKAKCLSDADGDFSVLAVKDSNGNDKKSRSGNALTHEITFLAKQACKIGLDGFSEACADNIGLLVEIRDNAIHFINPDLHLALRVQEVGTAALMNYLDLITRWFKWDMRRYHFYLMPLSFYHPFEALQPTVDSYNESTKNFLKYIQTIEAKHRDAEAGDHQVTVRVETKISRAKGEDAVQWRYTDNPDAPEMRITEEDIRKTHPLSYKELTVKLRARYKNFKEDTKFHALRKKMLAEGVRYCRVRLLDPDKPNSTSKKFYSTEVFKEFDAHYTRNNGTRV